MKLRELFENVYEEVPDNKQEFDGGLKTIGICYGRWNPPHKGHRAAWKQASANPIWFVGTNRNTSGPKDPLPYDVKLQCMAAVWPAVAKHVIPEQDLFSMCSHIYDEYGSNVHLKIYTDEEWLYNAVVKYNGLKDQKHGSYNFSQIDWVKTERLASATNLRAAVRSGNRDSFYQDAGIRPDTVIELNKQAMPVFDVVAHYLNQYPEKPASGKKAAVATADLGEQLAEMAAALEESKMKKITKSEKSSMKNATTFPSLNMSTGSGGAYMNYRFGIAMAGAPANPGPADNFIGGDPLLTTYTEEEMDIINSAAKAVGAGSGQNWSGKKSKELPSTNTKSPTATPKKNKYGI